MATRTAPGPALHRAPMAAGASRSLPLAPPAKANAFAPAVAGCDRSVCGTVAGLRSGARQGATLECGALASTLATGAAVVAALAALLPTAARRAPERCRRPMVAMHAEARALSTKRATKEQQATILEAALLTLFKSDAPDIYEVRSCLTRLATLTTRPNSSIVGDWIIFWASKEGSVDTTFGTGITLNNWWLKLQEYLIRFRNRKEGRTVEAFEILRKVGPFPNQSTHLKGTYVAAGTNGLQIDFQDMRTDEGTDIKLADGTVMLKKSVVLDVIYSSPKILAIQAQDSNGECDFFVLTPVEDVQREADRLTGQERRKYFLN